MIGRPESWRRRSRVFCALTAVGYGIRVVLWLLPEGSSDIHAWRIFAQTIRTVGLAETYRLLPLFNHPPIMGWWSVVALRLADYQGPTFAQAFKLPSLLAELATAYCSNSRSRPFTPVFNRINRSRVRIFLSAARSHTGQDVRRPRTDPAET